MTEKRIDCPEHFCIQEFRPQEMVAHLQWDHGYRESQAENIVSREVPKQTAGSVGKSDENVEGSQ